MEILQLVNRFGIFRIIKNISCYENVEDYISSHYYLLYSLFLIFWARVPIRQLSNGANILVKKCIYG